MANSVTSTRERALALLGTGIPAETVAATLGVTPSAISQLLSESEFASQVAQLRYEALSKHNLRDTTYDELEDALVQRMKDSIPFLTRPLEIARAIQIINAAKRRGSSAPEAIISQQQVVSLTVPIQIIQKFQTTQNKQVTHAGEVELITMQAGTLLKEIENDSTIDQGAKTALPVPA